MADDMDEDSIPSERELELLGQLREKEKQVNALVEDITALRAFVPTQPLPAPAASSQALPPSLLALLTPLLRANPPSGVPSASIITSRVELLQRENDELYELLKESNVAQLKEEVRLLRQSVVGMDTALRESHATITSLSTQLSQAQEALISLGNPPPSASPISPAVNTTHPIPNGNGVTQSPELSPSSASKPIPTGPRAQAIKRPPRAHPPPESPTAAVATSAAAAPSAGPSTSSGLSVRGAASTPTHELPRRPSPNTRRTSRSRSPEARNSTERNRDRYGDRDSGRPRDRTPPPGGRRQDNGGGDRGGGRRRHGNNNARGQGASGPVGPVESRSLVERMGL